MTELFVGTSGYAYNAWKGVFYPDKLPQKEFLRFYGENFGSVEINNTFYRMPSESVIANWGEQVPAGFRFVLKVSRRITHFKRLKECDEVLDYVLSTAAALGDKLGPLLFQLPPNFKADVDRLRAFLATLPSKRPAVFEFRHPSWDDDAVREVMAEKGVVYATAEVDPGEGDETEGPPVETPIFATGSWGYLRLRKVDYSNEELVRWHQRIKEQDWDRAYVFFKHEDKGTGPEFAQRFLALA
jgi:uncharacterized protein YecE (DUF72 family)